MSLTVIKTPTVIVDSKEIRWNAVYHPIVFELQRKDQDVEYRFTMGTGMIIRVTTTPPVLGIGEFVQYHAPNGVIYDLTVTAVLGQHIAVEEPYIGFETGGYVVYPNLYPSYFVRAKIVYVADGATWHPLGTMRVVPDIDGVVKINVAKFLQSVCTFENEFDYDQINKRMLNEGTRFAVTFEEIYEGQEGVITSATGTYYFTNSAKQIQELHGSNMAEYTPIYDDQRVDKAKFLTVFNKPTYFVGYPFSLNFIYSDLLGRHQITREEETFNINNGSVATTSDNLIINERYFNNRLMINQGYPPEVKEIDVWLDAGAEVTTPQIGGEFYSDGTIFEPWLESRDQPQIADAIITRR